MAGSPLFRPERGPTTVFGAHAQYTFCQGRADDRYRIVLLYLVLESTRGCPMARIVAGFASSHTPLMSLPGEHWAKRADDDTRNRELIRPSDGAHVTYDQLLESADPKIAEQIREDVFVEKYAAI